MKIGFSGVHGTGKTTLLKEMLGWPELCGHAFVSGLTRAQANAGVPINHNGTFEGQKTLTNTMIWYLKTIDDLVLDRTLIDIYSYTAYHRDHGKLDSQDLNYIRTRARGYQPLFDVVFFIRPEFEVSGDSHRSADPSFAIEIAAIMEHTISMEEALGTKSIVMLSGTIEQRLNRIQEWLHNESPIRRSDVSDAVAADQISTTKQ